MKPGSPLHVSRSLACVRRVAAVIAMFSAGWPQPGHAAPAKPSVSEIRAAEGFKAFDEAITLDGKGKREAAEQRYRAAAEAYAAALASLDRASPDYMVRRITFAGRIAKAYAAARLAFDNPALRKSASEWCTRWSSEPDATNDELFASLRVECAHWPSPAPEPVPVAVEPIGQPGTTADPQGEKAASPSGEGDSGGPTTIPKGALDGNPGGPTEPPRAPPPDKLRQRLMIGGGVALGLGGAALLVSLVGAVRQVKLERDYKADNCETVYQPHCQGAYDRGERLEDMSVATVVAGSILVGTGAVLVGIAARRRGSKVAVAPALDRQFLGLALRGSF